MSLHWPAQRARHADTVQSQSRFYVCFRVYCSFPGCLPPAVFIPFTAPAPLFAPRAALPICSPVAVFYHALHAPARQPSSLVVGAAARASPTHTHTHDNNANLPLHICAPRSPREGHPAHTHLPAAVPLQHGATPPMTVTSCLRDIWLLAASPKLLYSINVCFPRGVGAADRCKHTVQNDPSVAFRCDRGFKTPAPKLEACGGVCWKFSV